MKEIVGNFWEHAPKYELICVTTNGIVKNNGELVMGAGIAKQFKERFPELSSLLGKQVKAEGNIVHLNFINETFIVSLPTKHHWRDASDVKLIVESCKNLEALVAMMPFGSILMTRLGCGLGQLVWEDVKKEIDFLDDRFTVINL